MSNQIYLLALSYVKGLGPRRIQKILNQNIPLESIFSLSYKDVSALVEADFDKNGGDWTDRKKYLDKAQKELDLATSKGFSFVCLLDEDYPDLLEIIYDPPPYVYIYGSLQRIDCESISIVGTRTPTRAGAARAYHCARELASNGLTIISGMALGVDTEAHKGALDANGRTIAILGSGIDYIYPSNNTDLYHRIAKQGAVLSEFPLGSKPERGNFPRRNRLISGLGNGVLVVEGGEDSGSLITAKHALDQGRNVYAFPGPPQDPHFKGTNNLIREGALLIDDAKDILKDLKYIVKTSTNHIAPEIRVEELEPEEQKVYHLLDEQMPLHFDHLYEKVNMKVQKLSEILQKLEIKSLCRQLPGSYYLKN